MKKGRRTSVESDVRADVDKGQDNRDDAGNGDGVGRDLQLVVDMADPVAEGQSPITSERPGLTRSGQVERQGTGEDQNSGDGVERDDTSG